MSALMIYITYPNAKQARDISKVLVERRLVACANIFPAHESLFWWDGAVQSSAERAVIYKTTDDKFDAVRDAVLELHGYECPCIVALPIEKGHEPFMRWIEAETKA